MTTATMANPQDYGNTSHRIAVALRREWDGARSAVKSAARAIGVSDRTLENWWSARSEPRASEMVAMMAAFAEVEAEVLAMVAERKRKLGK